MNTNDKMMFTSLGAIVLIIIIGIISIMHETRLKEASYCECIKTHSPLECIRK